MDDEGMDGLPPSPPIYLPTYLPREGGTCPASVWDGLPGPTPSCPEEGCEEGGARAKCLFAELSTLWLWRPPLLCSLVVVVVVAAGARESAHAAEAWRGACRTAATAKRIRQWILVRRRSLWTGNGARAGGGWFVDEDLEAKPPGRPLRAPDGVRCTFQYRD